MWTTSDGATARHVTQMPSGRSTNVEAFRAELSVDLENRAYRRSMSGKKEPRKTVVVFLHGHCGNWKQIFNTYAFLEAELTSNRKIRSKVK